MMNNNYNITIDLVEVESNEHTQKQYDLSCAASLSNLARLLPTKPNQIRFTFADFHDNTFDAAKPYPQIQTQKPQPQPQPQLEHSTSSSNSNHSKLFLYFRTYIYLATGKFLTLS